MKSTDPEPLSFRCKRTVWGWDRIKKHAPSIGPDRLKLLTLLAVTLVGMSRSSGADWPLWQAGTMASTWILPDRDPRAARVAQATITRHLRELYGLDTPIPLEPATPGVRILLGAPANNSRLAELAALGLKLAENEVGEEGFQLLTWEQDATRSLIAYSQTARGLKHACQELLFFQVQADAKRGWMTAPINLVRRPAVPYRGIYMLPCWSAHDSAESWTRVLEFNSELTLNRNWFWLDGFPIAGHTGEYAGTALADPPTVQRLLNLAAAEEMKIYIGGGWFNWHHEKAVGKNLAKGRDYYLAYLKHFTNFHGFYIEPTGEGQETRNWRPECDALLDLVRLARRERPEFEFALAIGKFNNPEYLKLMSQLDPQRVFWWWCWGDPLRDKALDLYPSVLRWHLSQTMSDYHGSLQPPGPQERMLAGIATSYDPGQGFGNPWNGWGALGTDRPRNVHPHTIPYFGQQYFLRERCWQLDLSEAQFLARLQRRLFDVGAPAEASARYWRLCRLAQGATAKQAPSADELAPIAQLVTDLRQRPSTPRMADTLTRMEEALDQLRQRVTNNK